MKRVLVVDDKEENIYYLTSLLAGHGYEVESARHGAEALEKARRTPPELVISDLLMPVMDGYTLLRHWKSDARLRLAPFIVYTATYTDPEDERLARRLGADAFILKPAEPETLITCVRAVSASLTIVEPVEEDERLAGSGELLREYNEALIRKLEQKTLQLEEANRRLQRDIAERERVDEARKKSEERSRQLEEQLRQAQKMEAVGRLAGGVAHDFNNLLSVILSYSSLALDELSPDAPVRAEIAEVLRAGERARDLTRQLLAFSRQQMLSPRVLDLGRVVRDMEKMLRALLNEDVELDIQVATSASNVYADPSQIEQLIMNLAVNAGDAMPRGGKLTLEVGEAGPGDDVAAGPWVTLTVRDTGVGMDAATRERIFEPFFTTKEPGKGTGLGLATVFGIVTQSHGHIDVQSEPKLGTTFRVHLPKSDRVADGSEEPRATPVTLRGSETILLVEDDAQVREINCTILRRHGYNILAAADGAAALAASAEYLEPIHLLLTDVVMPRMGGRELASALTSQRPEMRVLYLSGYAESSVAHDGIPARGIAFLQKPITPEVLLRRVREVLSER